MAHRSGYPMETPLTECDLITGHLVGAGAANMAVTYGDIVSATRTGTGVFDLVFRHKYPQKIMPFRPEIVGTTVGLDAVFSAWNPAAGTATVKFSVGAAATDPAGTDEVYFAFLVRNSGRNPSTV